MKRTDKAEFIESYKDKFSRAVIAVLADYRGLDVDTLNGLRRKLELHADGEFHVVKNSLCRRAIAGTEKEVLDGHFQGPTSVYLNYEDPVGPAKTLVDFAKENKQFDLKAGFYDGQLLDKAQIKALSQMPSKETLQAMLIGLLQTPSRNLVNLLSNVPRGLLNVLNAHKAKLEEEEEAA